MGRPKSFYQGYNPYCEESWKCCTPAPCSSGACCWYGKEGGVNYGCGIGISDPLCMRTNSDECFVFGGTYVADSGCLQENDPSFVYNMNNAPQPTNGAVYRQPYGSGCAGFPITCFTSGSLVPTDQGLREIQDLEVGDRVKTLDGEKIINRLITPILGDRRLISINNSKFFFTEDHPIKTLDGFKAANYKMSKENYSYVDIAGELSIGDSIITGKGYETVKDIKYSGGDYNTKLYDISIESPHEFICEDFVFHNCCGCSQNACFSGCDVPHTWVQSIINWDTKVVEEQRTLTVTESGCYPTTFLAQTLYFKDGSCCNPLIELIDCVGPCCDNLPRCPNPVKTTPLISCIDNKTDPFPATNEGPVGCPYVEVSGWGACCPPLGKFGAGAGDCVQTVDEDACIAYWESEGEFGPVVFHPGEKCSDNPCNFTDGACCYDDGNPCVEVSNIGSCGGTFYIGQACNQLIPGICTG